MSAISSNVVRLSDPPMQIDVAVVSTLVEVLPADWEEG